MMTIWERHGAACTLMREHRTPACSGPTLRSFTSGGMGRATDTTQGPTPGKTCTGGPTESQGASPRIATSTVTSTTPETPTRCATRAPSALPEPLKAATRHMAEEPGDQLIARQRVRLSAATPSESAFETATVMGPETHRRRLTLYGPPLTVFHLGRRGRMHLEDGGVHATIDATKRHSFE